MRFQDGFLLTERLVEFGTAEGWKAGISAVSVEILLFVGCDSVDVVSVLVSEWGVLFTPGYDTNADVPSACSESNEIFSKVLVSFLQISSKYHFTREPSSDCTTTDTGPVNLVM